MKISGPYHKFISLPDGDSGHDYINLLNDQSIEVADDVLMEIYPNILEIQSYNPSTKKPFKGINTTGPTVLSGEGLKTVLSALDKFIENILQGPDQIELGGSSLKKKELHHHLLKFRDYIADALDKKSKVLHLGI